MPVLVVAAALLALQLSPRENVFHQRPLNYKSHYENFYNRFLPCVRVTASNLQYTGLNRTVGGAVKGYYYYTLVDGFCQFYLLGAEAGTPPAPSIESLDIHGRLIELDANQYGEITDAMASALGWKSSSLRKITAPYAVSSLSCPFFISLAGRLAVNLCLFAGLAELFCSLVFFIFPLASPAFRYLGNIWEVRQKISEAEAELHSQVPVKAGKLYLTTSYLLYLDGARTRLLPLEELFWAGIENRKDCRGFSRFVRRLSALLPKRRRNADSSAFLSLAASDGKFIRLPCPSRESAESILSSLRVQNGRIHFGDKPEKRQIAAELKKRERVLKE